MLLTKSNPVESARNLRARVNRLLRESSNRKNSADQLSFDHFPVLSRESNVDFSGQSVPAFLDLITDALPDGDVYLFGGVLRDLALLGQKGFNSDIDLVVDGDWSHVVPYIESLGVHKNKFGGYRLMVGGWPIDIWNAKETWAIKQGLVSYKGVASLIETTVLNWDAILMNWRTQHFLHQSRYFEDINSRVMSIVLEKNPNPLGMAVRVFRHMCLKDAKKITTSAATYMASCTKAYSFEEIQKAELRSYNNAVIEQTVYKFFRHIDASEYQNMQHKFSVAGDIIERELGLR